MRFPEVYIFVLCTIYLIDCVWGVEGSSANSRAGRVMIHARQEGNPVQHDAVAGIGSNFKNLTLDGLYLSTIKYRKNIS